MSVIIPNIIVDDDEVDNLEIEMNISRFGNVIYSCKIPLPILADLGKYPAMYKKNSESELKEINN